MSPMAEPMAKKKPGRPPETEATSVSRKGRPKRGGRIASRIAVVATPEYKVWAEEFAQFAGESEVSDLVRAAMRNYAEVRKFRMPPPR